MAEAYFSDGDIANRKPVGATFSAFETLADAKQACIDHAKKQKNFVEILLAEDDGDIGWDMAVRLGNQIRLYCANA